MARKRFQPMTRIREMLGKDPEVPWVSGYNLIRSVFSSVFQHKTKISQLRSNYALFHALYYSSRPEGLNIDESFIMGSGFAKPIINSTVAFAMGNGFKVKIGGATDNEKLKALQTDLQEWVDKNYDRLLDWAKYGTRDGDGFLFTDEMGNIGHLKPETVEVIVDAVSGELLGYDVTEIIKERNQQTGREEKFTYLRIYRRTHTTIIRMADNQDRESGTVVYERVYSTEGEINTAPDENGVRQPVDLLPEELEQRPLPITHFINELEPGYLYGNSELQNLLIYMRNYGEVLDEATKRDVYNSKPIVVFTGVSNPKNKKGGAATASDMPKDKDGNPQLNWAENQSVFLHNKDAKAAYLTVPNTMENSGKLLEYLFYCIVQASETPEFVLGTAVSSSKASVQQQMPVVVQKAERKRNQMRRTFIELLRLHVYRQIQLSNPIYLPLRDIYQDADIDVKFPDIIDEDKQLNVSIVQALLDAGAIGNADARDILLSGRFEDDPEVDQRGLDDLAKRTTSAGVLPASNRLQDELDSDDEE